MSRLKPGATYIYENADGVIYAREINAAPDTRIEIGRTFGSNIQDDLLWNDIRKTAQTNTALQEALDRAIIIYKLSKTDDR